MGSEGSGPRRGRRLAVGRLPITSCNFDRSTCGKFAKMRQTFRDPA